MYSFPAINVVRVLLIILLNASVKPVITSETPEDPTGWSDSKFSIEEDLVDPTGWNYDRATKIHMGERENMFAYCDNLLKGRSENVPVENNQKERPSFSFKKSVHDSKSNIAFVRRFISILLESADLNNQNNVNQDVLHGLLEIKMNVGQYERLLQFSQSRENISFRELDSILSNTIHAVEEPIAVKGPIVGRLIDTIHYLFSLTELFLPLILCILGLYFVRLTIVSKSISQFLLSLFLVIFFAAYIFEYYKRYKIIEIEQMVTYGRYKNIPSSCSAEQDIWNRMWFWFQSQDDCAEYHKAVLIDPFYKVSPLGVLSCTFVNLFTEPATMVGSAIAGFSREILGTLPIAYGWFVYLVSFLGFFVIIALIFIFLCGGALRFGNFFGGVAISSSKTPLIASTALEALTNSATASSSSSEQPLPQISSVNGSGNYILMEANTLKSLLAADKVAPANRVQELEHHIVRSQSVPAELIERSASNEFIKDSESLPAKINEDICVCSKEKEKCVLSKSQSYQEKSLSRNVTSDETERVTERNDK